MRKLFTWLLISVFMMSSFSSAIFAAQTVDVTGHWAADDISAWLESGLISGYEDGSFMPDNDISRAEFFTLIENVVQSGYTSDSIFSDVSSDDWYYSAVMSAFAMGLTTGYPDGTFKPSQGITRQEAAVVITRAMAYESDGGNRLGNYSDGMAESWASDSVENLLQRELLTGYPDNSIRLEKSITRAEAVVLLSRVFGTVYASGGSYDAAEIAGNLTVSSADVILNNMVIKGDLYIAEGVGDGDITLNDVTVEGDTIVKGGGENSINFNNVTINGRLNIKKADNKVRIVASGSTKVAVTIMGSGAILLEKDLTGDGFSSVMIRGGLARGATIVLNGSFDTVDVGSDGINITVPAGSTVKSIIAKGEGLTVSGTGTVTEVQVKADNVTVNTDGTKVTVDPNVEGTTAGGEDVSGGSTTTTDDSPSGGSSGGSSSDDDDTYTVTLNKSTVTLEEGETEQLTATVKVDGTVTTTAAVSWSTSSSSVATVSSSGLVTAVADGSATITVSVDGQSGVTDTCAVTVSTPSDTYTVTLDKTSATIDPDEKVLLTPTVKVNGTTTDAAVTWVSSNTSAATVDSDGVVTGVADGSATITVKLSDDTSVTATCAVTVSTTSGVDLVVEEWESIYLTTNITTDSALIITTDSSLVVTTTASIDITTTGSGVITTTAAISWSVDDETVLNISNLASDGEVFTDSAGTATITVTLELDADFKATYGVSDVTSTYTMKVYPLIDIP